MRGTGFVAVLAAFALLAGPASAQKVGNPTSSLGAVIDGGFFNFHNQTSGAFHGPVGLAHDASITKDGSIDVPMADLGPVVIPIPNQSGNTNGCNWSVTNASVTIVPTADATGLLNPFTGAASLTVHYYLKGTYTATIDCFPGQSYTPSNCEVGSPDMPLELDLTTGTTAPPSDQPNKPIHGTPYTDSNGKFRVVDNTFGLPGSTGCDPQIFGFTLSGEFNNQAGLPSDPGNNTLIIVGHLSPVIARGVRAKLTATPQTGLAPLTVSLSASGSFVPAGAKSYAFTFGDGSPKVTGTTPTRSHKYAKPGVYTATVTVTDKDGDSNSTIRHVTVRKACIVPRVVGKKLAAARTAIRTAGCTVGKLVRQTASKPSGVVLRQHPAPGTRLAFGAPVALVVSRGH
jgi:PKD repeat protein